MEGPRAQRSRAFSVAWPHTSLALGPHALRAIASLVVIRRVGAGCGGSACGRYVLIPAASILLGERRWSARVCGQARMAA